MSPGVHPGETPGEPSDATPPRPRRKHRRAVGGTVPPAPEPAAGPPGPEDVDAAWGDQLPGPDDERFLREVPPHW